VDVVLLFASFAVILAGALLFTNAVEWAGNRLAIGEGATGSLLAAVGTAMPETLIPIVALIGGAEGAEDVAIGAIIGAPFLLATIAMMLVGLAALGFRARRPQRRQLKADVETLDRDLVFFLIFFALGLGLGLGIPDEIQILAAVGCVIAYGLYVRRTLAGGGAVQERETIAPLILTRHAARALASDNPSMRAIALQFLVGLGAMVGGAHLFVEELITVASDLGVEAIVLSLVLAPLATELPEKANSFFWVREGKDTLALGNITGAMVFQSTLPIAFGLVFTAWELDRFAILSAALGLAGGVVAYWALRLRGRFSVPAITLWGALYGAFLAYVLATG
jgi:cation:H+ antiporter